METFANVVAPRTSPGVHGKSHGPLLLLVLIGTALSVTYRVHAEQEARILATSRSGILQVELSSIALPSIVLYD
jgi:hypothetical protein